MRGCFYRMLIFLGCWCLLGHGVHASAEKTQSNFLNHINLNLLPSEDRPSFQWLGAMEESTSRMKLRSIEKLPEKVDFSADIPIIHHQGSSSSCTAQAITVSMEYLLQKSHVNAQLSPLFLYYNTRELGGNIHTDNGAYLSDGIWSVCTQGVCQEHFWPYKPEKLAVKPSENAYKDAKNYVDLDEVGTNHLPQDLHVLKSTLAENIPIVFGVRVYPSMISHKVRETGKIPIPKESEHVIGGHALTLVGYDDATESFKFVNSWGKQWGDGGFGYLTYDYVMNPKYTYPTEFWSIRTVGAQLS